MRTLVIDTNALISFVTDRNPVQQEKIAVIFDEAARLKIAILCPQNVLTEFVYVLEKIYNLHFARLKADFVNYVESGFSNKNELLNSHH